MRQMRLSFREPFPAIFDAARMLDASVSAYQTGYRLLASQLVEAAKIPAVGEWGYSIWGAKSLIFNCKSVMPQLTASFAE